VRNRDEEGRHKVCGNRRGVKREKQIRAGSQQGVRQTEKSRGKKKVVCVRGGGEEFQVNRKHILIRGNHQEILFVRGGESHLKQKVKVLLEKC